MTACVQQKLLLFIIIECHFISVLCHLVSGHGGGLMVGKVASWPRGRRFKTRYRYPIQKRKSEKKLTERKRTLAVLPWSLSGLNKFSISHTQKSIEQDVSKEV